MNVLFFPEFGLIGRSVGRLIKRKNWRKPASTNLLYRQ